MFPISLCIHFGKLSTTSAKTNHLGCVEGETAAWVKGGVTGVCWTAVQLQDLKAVLFWKLHFWLHFLQHFNCAQPLSLWRQAPCSLHNTSSNENCDFSALFQVSRISHRWPDQCETLNYCCDKQQRHLERFAVQTSPLIAAGECAMMHIDKS